jgi:Beta-ketoacyl synthase, N-terminal domain
VSARTPKTERNGDSAWENYFPAATCPAPLTADCISLSGAGHPDRNTHQGEPPFIAPGASTPGLSRVRRGGFLTQPVDQFDAAFFGISPREADYIDPQQRVLLEVAWKALEDAGATLEELAGSATGVFVGGFTLDYGQLQFSGAGKARTNLGAHTATGIVMTMFANRISHAFDLRGHLEAAAGSRP